MHSSGMRGSDFEFLVNGDRVEHADFFSGFANTTRLGILAPRRFEGAGAVNLVMAHVTAFYDCYRATTDAFFAYPDYFTFQSVDPRASYGMFDIWPEHKSVGVSENAGDRLDAITDRAINVLLVPDGQAGKYEYGKLQMAAADRLIRTCYAYSADGSVQAPDLTVRCQKEPFMEWVQSMFESVKEDMSAEAAKHWQDACTRTECLEQSFRKISLKEALDLL